MMEIVIWKNLAGGQKRQHLNRETRNWVWITTITIASMVRICLGKNFRTIFALETS